jgi:acyl dehydratase
MMSIKSSSRAFSTENRFYKTSQGDTGSGKMVPQTSVIGSVIDHSLDLTKVRPGDVIEVPYEMTVSSSLRDFFHSAFYTHDRINTSTPFARSLGLQDQIVPFSLMLYLAASMSHADSAKIQTGFSRARYHWPAFAGDTFKKKFIIQSLRNTSDGHRSVIGIHCEIRNQRDNVVFTCEKTMMFPFKVPGSTVTVPIPQESRKQDFLEHLIRRTETLQGLGSQTLTSLRPGQLVLHTLARPLSQTHTMQLATLGRLTHERHFNKRLFRDDELLVPGGLVLALTTSLASRDLHEVLFEELNECTFPNATVPGETIGAITFVQSREEHMSGDMEKVELRTIGIKNVDAKKLQDRELPLSLFEGPILKPKALEELLKVHCPELSGHIVCIADRTIFRQAPKQVPFLL